MPKMVQQSTKVIFTKQELKKFAYHELGKHDRRPKGDTHINFRFDDENKELEISFINNITLKEE